jgi:predicted TPR repeat methyltransferase
MAMKPQDVKPATLAAESNVDSNVDSIVDSALNAQCAGRLDEAESQYHHALRESPAHPAALHFLGILQHQKGQSDEGIALVRQSLELAPAKADWHNNLGNLLAAGQHDEDAAAAFLTALEIKSDNPVVWNNLGAVLQRAGQLENAVRAFENAIFIDPAYADALSNLCQVQTRQGKTVEAALSYCAAYVLHPTAEKSKQMLGTAYYSLGRIAEAAQTYRSWLDDDPDNPIARHLLASCSGRDVPDRASDAYLEMQFDNTAEDFDSKMRAGLAYSIPEMTGRSLMDLAIPPGSLAVLDAGCGTGLCGPHLAPFARHLVGVDLSGKSLAIAAEKEVYGVLAKTEIVAYLSTKDARFDLLVAADTFIYFGSLDAFLQAAANALGNDGLLIASIEECVSGADFVLNPSGRYSHSRGYVEKSFAAAGFEFHSMTAVDIRLELGKPARGLFLIARKQGWRDKIR